MKIFKPVPWFNREEVVHVQKQLAKAYCKQSKLNNYVYLSEKYVN